MKQFGKVSTLYVWSWAVLWCTLAGLTITIFYSLLRHYIPFLLTVLPLPYVVLILVCFVVALLALLGCLLIKRLLGMTLSELYFMLSRSHGLRVYLKPVATTAFQSDTQPQSQAVTSPLQLSALIWRVGPEAYCALIHPHQVGGQSAAKAVEDAFKTECDSLLPGYKSAGSSVTSWGILWHYYEEVDPDDEDEYEDEDE